MWTDFLDRVPADQLTDSDRDAIALLRSVLERTSPQELDVKAATVQVHKSSPLKSRYLEILLPHSKDANASLAIYWNDRDYIVETAYGDFEWGGDEEPVFEQFLLAAMEGAIEYETIHKKDGRPKRARAWRVDLPEPQLLGQMYSGLGHHAGWERASRARPSSFVWAVRLFGRSPTHRPRTHAERQ